MSYLNNQGVWGESTTNSDEDEQSRLLDARMRAQQQELLEEQERQRQQQSQPKPEAKPEPESRTPRQAAGETEKSEQERGWVTSLGEGLQALTEPVNTAAAAINALTPEGAPWKDATQSLDDNVVTMREASARLDEKLEGKDENGFVEGARDISTGISSGVASGLAIPVTLAARIANQDSSAWNEPPAELKDSWGGEVAFEIARVVAPTLVLGAAGLGAGGTTIGTLSAESAIETIPQRSAEDLIAGRELAIKVGEVANMGGFNGDEVTEALIRGERPDAQVAVFVAGFLSNYGINLGADYVFKAIAKRLFPGSVSETAETVAQATGKNVQDVQKSLDDIELPKGDRDLDINEAVSIDTSVPKPSGSNQVVNEDALQATAIRRSPSFNSDGLTTKDNSFFTNFKVFSDNESYRRALDEATKSLAPLFGKNTDTKDKVLLGAQRWINEFIDETNAGIDIDRAIVSYPSDMTEPLDDLARTVVNLENGVSTENYLKSWAVTNPEGVVASTLIGEELGIRLSQSARRITNLDDGGIDFTKAVEDYLDLQDKAELFLTPLRRFKARWNVSGLIQQTDEVAKVKGGKGIRDAKPAKVKGPDAEAPYEAFQMVRKDTTDEGATLRQLWERYKAGSADAGQTIKTYFNLMSFAPPRTAVTQVDNLSKTLAKQLKLGNDDATKTLYYAYMLTRIAPQSASLASNVVNLIKEPVGLALAGEGRYAAGQVFGALSVFSDALQVGKKAFLDGQPINTGRKIDANIYDTKLANTKLDALYEGVQRELNARKAPAREFVTAWWNYTRQKIANHPLNSIAGRGFLAADEWTKVMYGGMTASGRAFKDAPKSELKLKELLQKQYKDVFTDGVKKGELNPEVGVIEGANAMTFSNAIPQNGNFVDKAFESLQRSGNESAFWTFVSPFTRMSYWGLEKGGILLAGSIPRVGGKVLQKYIPRYKSIMAGEAGELARLQLKANLNFGGYTAFMVGSLSGMGMMTGNNPPEGMPKTSFIVPAPGTKKGWIGVPYGRLEPIATPFAIISDLTTNFRDNVISEPDYNRAIQEVLTAFGLATLDKTFTSGLTNVASLLDVKNFSDGSVVAGVNSAGPIVASSGLPIGAAGGLTRMVSDWVNPYQSISKEDDNLFANVWAAIAQRNLGGATLPTRFNPWNGEAVRKVSGLGSGYWGDVMNTIGNEVGVPGGLKDAGSNDIFKAFDLAKLDTKIDLRSYKGIALSMQEQSVLSKDLNDVGNLSARMNRLLASKRWVGPQLSQALRAGDTPKADKLRLEAQQQLRSVIQDAKEEAVRTGRLAKDVDFVQKLNPPSQANNSTGSSNPVTNLLASTLR